MKKIVLALLVLCCACAGPSVVLKKNTTIEKLGIYLEIGDQAMPLVSNSFENELDFFIDNYNAQPNHKFKLYRASASDSSCLHIKLVASQLVSPGQQAAGVFVSLAGLSLPILMVSAGSPIYLFFYYFPNVKSMTELSLSNDIAEIKNSKKPFVLASPGFLKSTEKQVEKHVMYFDNFLGQLVKQIEKQSKTPKPGSSIAVQ